MGVRLLRRDKPGGGLDCPGIGSWWGEIFHTLPDQN